MAVVLQRAPSRHCEVDFVDKRHVLRVEMCGDFVGQRLVWHRLNEVPSSDHFGSPAGSRLVVKVGEVETGAAALDLLPHLLREVQCKDVQRADTMNSRAWSTTAILRHSSRYAVRR